MSTPALHHRRFLSYRLTAFLLLSVGVHAGVLLSTGSTPPIQGVESGRMEVRLEPGKTVTQPGRTTSSAKQTVNNTEATSEPDRRDRHADSIPTALKPAKPDSATATQNRIELSENTRAAPPARYHLKTNKYYNNQLQSRVKKQLQESLKIYLEYPEMARRRGWEGEVTVSLQLTREGIIRDIALNKSSGHRILDDHTLKTIKNLPRLEWASSILDGNGMTIQLPVIYQLSRI